MREHGDDRGGRAKVARELALIALSLVLVTVHFLLPPNRGGVRFVVERLKTFPAEWSFFWKERNPEMRMRADYGMNYDGPIFIRENLKSNEILQLPPRTYLSRYFPPGQDGWAEPRFIYYVAGPLKTVAWRGTIRPDATRALVVDTLGAEPRLRIADLDGPLARDRIAELYRGADPARP